ncbi:imidazole glycerol phosphate synthase subunit HisF [Tenacibaculum singaporense]|uniref:Imidazole glycerol phosphate synthase subunit HisF n=1 Tax=Tenacibaculum singaporense TaxID=2358479 RepID=A0A3S8R7W2_9FLAO|nr:imidazole glycerol phosphate synthase subunit HisF [Tenacibaculum singaporense]AZJ35855.1 imidazole glycerol phosphate synthase subunit HisF [Tenacibaculum singaporense]
MLKKRIIPCLDIKNGRTVKGVNFVDIKDAGDPVELAKQYVKEGADELVFLDITATLENRKTFVKLVEKIAKEINIPFTVGGGISTVEDAVALIQAGADKVSINSSAVKNPQLITDLKNRFGSQFVVVAIDTKNVNGDWKVFTKGGTFETELETVSWAIEIEKLGAGEILLTSMNSDGTKNGFDIEVTDAVSKAVNIPVIASGGAGKVKHFTEVFTKTQASAGLAASIFHFGEIPIPVLKSELKKQKIAIR